MPRRLAVTGALLAVLACVAAAGGGSLGVAASAPGSSLGTRRARHPATATPPLSAAAAGSAFGLTLMRRLGPGNLVFSPDSIAAALAMAGAGAVGETAAQIVSVLQLPSYASLVGVGRLQQQLAAEQAPAGAGSSQAPTLDVANGLFVQEGFAIEPAFLSALQSGFTAAPQAVNFETAPAAAAETVNAWVSAHTDGLIPGIVGTLTPETRLLLADAVYLKASWLTPFPRRATAPAPFEQPGGAVSVAFMNEQQTLPYARGAGWQALELPYGASTLSLLVLLPPAGRLAALERALDPAMLGRIVAHLTPRGVAVSLPRFQLSLLRSLNGPLEALGMRKAFSAGAEFSGISTAVPLHISAVQHAADITVAEEGTVAAAATTVGIEIESAVREAREPIRFDADRPFLFFLRDDRSGALLFAGRLSDAASAQR